LHENKAERLIKTFVIGVDLSGYFGAGGVNIKSKKMVFIQKLKVKTNVTAAH
jgi:hypothetical protein